MSFLKLLKLHPTHNLNFISSIAMIGLAFGFLKVFLGDLVWGTCESLYSLYLESIINHKSIKMKQVKCADLGNDCDFVAKGTLEEVMSQVADHATGVHKMKINEDVIKAVKGVITDV